MKIRKSTGKDVCACCGVLIPKGSDVYEHVDLWMENRCFICKDRKNLTTTKDT